MEKDVLIFLNSSQSGGAVEDDKIEVITGRLLLFQNGKHSLFTTSWRTTELVRAEYHQNL